MTITAKLIGQRWNASESRNGNVQYEFTQSFYVNWKTYDDGTPNPYAARWDDPTYIYELQDPSDNTDPPENKRKLVQGLPRMFSKLTLPVNYVPPSEDPPPLPPNTPNKHDYYCTGYSADRMSGDDPAMLWRFDFTFSTGFGLFKTDGEPMELSPNGSDEVLNLAPDVQVSFDQEWVFCDDAQHVGMCIQQNVGFNPTLDSSPAWLKPGGVGVRGPVTDTALTQKNVNKPKSYVTWAVTVNRALWDVQAAADRMWTVNTDEFRIWDGANGCFDVVYNPGELLFMRPIVNGTFWHAGKKYARVTYTFRAASVEGRTGSNERRYFDRKFAHYHFEPDVGKHILCVANVNYGPHGTGTAQQYTQQDITDLLKETGVTSQQTFAVESAYVPITANLKNATGGTAKAMTGGNYRLNGFGNLSGYNRSGGSSDGGYNSPAWFTAWKIYREGPFADLNLPQPPPPGTQTATMNIPRKLKTDGLPSRR